MSTRLKGLCYDVRAARGHAAWTYRWKRSGQTKEAGIFPGALAVIALACFIGRESEKIAKMKGHEGRRYFWWSFLPGGIGWAMVIALPGGCEEVAAAVPEGRPGLPAEHFRGQTAVLRTGGPPLLPDLVCAGPGSERK